MFTAVIQSSKVALRRPVVMAAVSRPAAVNFIRLNSTQSPDRKDPNAVEEERSTDQKPPVLEKIAQNERLQRFSFVERDWDAAILKYEEVLPKTQNPTLATYLIDVREPDEVIQGMIPSAVNLPLTRLATSLALDANTFRKEFGFEKPRRDQEVIFYCRSGKRSASACDIAKRNGYRNIFNYEGSWLDWTEKQSKN